MRSVSFIFIYVGVGGLCARRRNMATLNDQKIILGKPSYRSLELNPFYAGPFEEVVTENLTVTTINGASYPPPPGTGFVTFTGAETLSNKSLVDNSTYIIDVTDATIRMMFDAAGTAGTTATVRATQTANRIYTIPNALADDVFALLATAQTFTNKTMTSTTNTVAAQLLHNLTGTVNVSGAAAPAAGQVLTATSATTAAWQPPSPGASAFSDALFQIFDSVDPTITLTFDAAGSAGTNATIRVAQAGNRIYTVPNATADDTFVLLNTTQTLTNKTLTTPVIATITNGGALTLPTGPDTLVARNSTDTMTNKTLTLPTIASINNGGTLTLPTGPQTLVGRTTTDTLTNKTLTLPTIASINNGGTLTLPTGPQTLVGRTTTDTLTNKTMTSATNTIAAKQLHNLTGTVDVSGSAAPVAGQTLVAVGATVATWQTPSVTTVSGILPVANGGTGVSNITLNGVMIGNGTSPITFAKAAPTGDFVGTTDTQTLSGKTLTTPIISQIVNTGTLTLPTATDTLVARTTTDTLTNKTIVSTTNTVAAQQLHNLTGTVDVSGSAAPTVGQVLTATGATTATWQAVTSTYVDTTFAIVDNVDPTIRVNFDATGTTGTTTTLRTAQTANRVLTFPSGAVAANVLLSEGNQTANGVNTFTASVVTPVITETVASAGTAINNVTIRSRALVTPAIQFASVEAGGAGNTYLGLLPSGTGAIVADTPDNAVAGGNARGTNAVDFQMSRVAATQVASGANSAILAGVNSTAAGTRSAVIAGTTHSVSGTNSAIFSGSTNTIVAGGNNSAIIAGSSNTLDGTRSVIAAGQLHTLAAASTDAFIAGGNSNDITAGLNGFMGGGLSNTLATTNGAVLAGTVNQVLAGSENVIVGGLNNTLNGGIGGIICAGDGNSSAAVNHTFIGAGSGNTVNNARGAIVAGNGNTVSNTDAVVVAGNGNSASGNRSGVLCGITNVLSAGTTNGAIVSGNGNQITAGTNAVICGGATNVISVNTAAICGGISNSIAALEGFIGGGDTNQITGVGSTNSVIGGGNSNTVSAINGVIGGGISNSLSGARAAIVGGNTNTASGQESFVGGGFQCQATNTYAVCSGGQQNNASGQGSTIAGGELHIASGAQATVGGGYDNTVAGNQATVAGGTLNSASNICATVGGGSTNTASGQYSGVSYGRDNTASGDYSGAFGRSATASATGAMTVVDGSGTGLANANPNRLNLRFADGCRIMGGPTSGFNDMAPTRINNSYYIYNNGQGLSYNGVGGFPSDTWTEITLPTIDGAIYYEIQMIGTSNTNGQFGPTIPWHRPFQTGVIGLATAGYVGTSTLSVITNGSSSSAGLLAAVSGSSIGTSLQAGPLRLRISIIPAGAYGNIFRWTGVVKFYIQDFKDPDPI